MLNCAKSAFAVVSVNTANLSTASERMPVLCVFASDAAREIPKWRERGKRMNWQQADYI